MMRRYLIGIIVLLIGLQGCASRTPSTKFYLTPMKKTSLPALQNSEKKYHAQQLLTTTVNKQPLTMLAIFDASDTEITLLGMTPVGVKLFKITYADNHIDVEKYIKMLKLPEPSQILADIMFAYFPQEAWQDRLPTNWTLDDSKEKRVLLDHEKVPVLTVRYKQDKHGKSAYPVAIEHHRFNYQIHLENLNN